jgi:cellulose synthase/poly-beta-1,6-N-acetylglucosamine synthase-like glycosyltransferase
MRFASIVKIKDKINLLKDILYAKLELIVKYKIIVYLIFIISSVIILLISQPLDGDFFRILKWHIFVELSLLLLFISTFSSSFSRAKGKSAATNIVDDKNILFVAILYLIMGGIFFILAMKIFFASFDFIILYLYGIMVTFVLFINFFVALFKYEDPAISAREKEDKLIDSGKNKSNPLVTCMVAVWNEEHDIEKCILSLVNQSYENKEIIFVNDGSADGTGDILDEYAGKGMIKVIHQENAGKKRALGNAMRQAKGTVFAFSDSDSTWAPDAIEKIMPIFKHFPEVGAVSGHFRLENSSDNMLTRMQDSWAEGQFAIRKAFESYFGSVTCVSGPLAVFRKSSIYNYIPAWEQDSFLGQEFKFATDRTLTGYLLGSKFIGEKIRQKYYDASFEYNPRYKDENWKIVYSKSARAWTILPNTWKRLFRQQIRWKKSFIRNTFFTGSFYWRKPFWPALVYYSHIVFVLGGPLITFRHLIYLPSQGNFIAAVLYIAGIVFVGLMFGLSYKLENKECHIWVYRPFMSLLSTLVLSWLVFYSALTIKKMIWHRG